MKYYLTEEYTTLLNSITVTRGKVCEGGCKREITGRIYLYFPDFDNWKREKPENVVKLCWNCYKPFLGVLKEERRKTYSGDRSQGINKHRLKKTQKKPYY